MEKQSETDDSSDELLTTGEIVIGVLAISFIVFCVIMLIVLGPLLFCILLIPLLWFLVLLVSLYGLAFGDPEDRWKFLIPLATSLIVLTSIFRSATSSIFDEDD